MLQELMEEKVADQRKKYMKEYSKKYAKKNKQKLKVYKAEWFQENKERTRAQCRENVKRYAQRHPEKVKALKAKWDADNVDHIKKYRRKYYLSERVNTKNWRLMKLYGITLEQYEEMLTKQKRCCAICGVHQPESIQSLHVDHNHTTKKVRGLLCHKCNRGLGLFKDSPKVLLNAAKYLQGEKK